MTLASAIEEFHLAGRADGLSRFTSRFYEMVLRRLERHFGAGRPLGTITAGDMRRYIVALREAETYADAPQKPPQGRIMSEESVNSHVRGLHRFFKWCADEFQIPNPMRSIKRPGKARSKPKAISAEDFLKLFRATTDSPMGIRDRAILAFFIDTGARLGGVLGLTLSDLDLKRRIAIVSEKRRPRRVLHFSKPVRVLLVAWLDVRPARPGVIAVFTTAQGTPLTYSGMQEIFKRLRARAGVTGPASIHGHRHSFAQFLMRSGIDLNTVSRLMGHAGIQITADQYGHMEPTQLGDAHDSASPFVFLLGSGDDDDSEQNNPNDF